MPSFTLPSFGLPAFALLAAVVVSSSGCAQDTEELRAIAARPADAVAAPLGAKYGPAGPPLGLPPVADPELAPYGSGRLGPWEDYELTLSTPEQFADVLAANGLLVVGDSIGSAVSRECAAVVGTRHGLPIAVNTWPSRPTAPAADWIVENAELIPDRGIVVVSGANDIFDPDGWWRQVERVVDAADGKPVYWLTVHVDRWALPDEVRAADRRNSAWVNDQLRWLAERHPGLVLVEWDAALTPDAAATLLDDGVHPSPAGIDTWCGQVTSAMGL
ncbi:hypothetical protein [Jiangella asiatica]|uniref:SGNH hydrolase-type esterase domain-containing protein n=1 Tax=Jiangella asiatica TaxID=2530372 RepID=A0A4R5DTX4_9ACTN|nr:hypothetical protein [Jiangella asiatica]TDE15894.1 hypothetical protein E1269_00960 [Jiangella asiatica]